MSDGWVCEDPAVVGLVHAAEALLGMYLPADPDSPSYPAWQRLLDAYLAVPITEEVPS